MIQAVDGEIYNIQFDTIEEGIKWTQVFFEDTTHENDIVKLSGCCDEQVYISAADIKNGLIDKNNYVRFSVRMFKEARRNHHFLNGGVVPVLNELDEPVLLLKVSSVKGYIHDYEHVNDVIDTRVFQLYDAVVMMGVTEYAYILLSEALTDYNGRIVCIGKEWPEFARLFQGRNNIEFIEKEDDMPSYLLRMKTMYLLEFNSIMAGHEKRCNEGFFSYDEIMTLVYFFSYRKSFGKSNPDKKYYLVDPSFPMEGLMSICDKCGMPYSYAEANGFIPVIHLTQSNQSIYSDYPGEDIWEKFFYQPFGPEANEWKNAVNVWQFPKACTTFSDRWLMRKIVDCKEVNFITLDYINDNVKKEVNAIRNKVLPNPNETIGALIRGTDYTTTQLPGHTIMASPEQVMTKLNELMSTGKYSHIYLATEDIDVLEKMQELCGEKITYIDQKRFRIKPGELLANQKKDRDNEGWLKGKEYLTSLKLLSECGAFVASGGCSGTDCALNSGKENYKETYVFQLGCN